MGIENEYENENCLWSKSITLSRKIKHTLDMPKMTVIYW